VLQWLTLGVFINSLAQIAFALVQGAGRPDLTAKLHLIELPFYLLAIWWLIGSYGIKGAAMAWVIRIGVDAIFLFGMAHRFLPIKASIIRKKILAAGAASTFILATWFLILAQDERMMIVNRFKTTQLPDCVEK
jgi:O-antigen/teichoic acid export membrane protein